MAAATNHPKACTLSAAIIYEHFNNDHTVALVYDLFTSLPIRLIVDSSRVDTIRAYDHGLRYPIKLPFMMTVFNQLMLDLPCSFIGQLDLQQHDVDDGRKILFDSIRLAMIIVHKFRLSKLDLEPIRSVRNEEINDQSDEKPIQMEELIRLIRIVFATMYRIKHSPIGHHDLIKQSMMTSAHPDLHNYQRNVVCQENVGRAFGAFGFRLQTVCPTEANVERHYCRNGKIIYKALTGIAPGNLLRISNQIPDYSGQQRFRWLERFNLKPCKDCQLCLTIAKSNE